MKLKQVLQQFLDEEKWEDEIGFDEYDQSYFIATNFVIMGQTYQLHIATYEIHREIKVVLSPPMKISTDRRDDAYRLINDLNLRIRAGNLEMNDDGMLYYRWSISVEGVEATPQQFGKLLTTAISIFDEIRTASLGAVAFTKLPIDQVLSDYNLAVEQLSQPQDASLH